MTEDTANFTLDTSGAIEMRRDLLANGVPAEPDRVSWSDLDPFTQGYVEALFKSFRRGDIGHWPDTPHAKRVMRFDRLAPESLAAILKDCAARQALGGAYPSAAVSAQFWENRQASCWIYEGFPPLTPSLGDDGKVYLRAAS